MNIRYIDRPHVISRTRTEGVDQGKGFALNHCYGCEHHCQYAPVADGTKGCWAEDQFLRWQKNPRIAWLSGEEKWSEAMVVKDATEKAKRDIAKLKEELKKKAGWNGAKKEGSK